MIVKLKMEESGNKVTYLPCPPPLFFVLPLTLHYRVIILKATHVQGIKNNVIIYLLIYEMCAGGS